MIKSQRPLITRRVATGAAVAALAAATLTGAAQAREETKISVLGAPFGTGTYILCNALEQISNKHPWLRVTASETPGYVFNLRKLNSDESLKTNTVIGSGPALMGLAARGVAPFKEKLGKPKLIANLTIVAVWLASLDDSLKGGSDIAGKRIALGKSAQINWAVLPRAVIENGWGVKDPNVQYLGPKPAVQALLDGKADVAIVGGYVNPKQSKLALAPPTLELVATGRKLNHIGFEKAAVEKTIEKEFKIVPFTVDAAMVEGNDQAIPTFIDTASWVVDPSFPEDVAYELTKMIIENVAAFGEAHAVGKLMSPESLSFGWKPEDMHPGALKAYKEAGLL
jgi:TRAP transporter TAXI family solute receptor